MDGDPVTIRVLFEEPEPPQTGETCPHCGQGFDCSQLAAALHHRTPAHEPLSIQ